jgi:hypothetical protein
LPFTKAEICTSKKTDVNLVVVDCTSLVLKEENFDEVEEFERDGVDKAVKCRKSLE